MQQAIATILFSEPSPLSAADIERKMAERWPNLPRWTRTEERGKSFTFCLDDVVVAVASIPHPMDWDKLKRLDPDEAFREDPDNLLPGHKANAVVTVIGGMDPIDSAMLLTKIVATLLAASPLATGVYWRNTRIVLPKADFLDSTARLSPFDLPLRIWLDVEVGASPAGGSSGFTMGLYALGFMEIEAIDVPEPADQLRDRLQVLASDLLRGDENIPDGETIDEYAGRPIRVVHSGSARGHKGTVARLDYGKPKVKKKKPWWKFW